MGNPGSKHEPWRETKAMGQSGRDELIKEIEEIKPPDGVPMLNILLVGQNGSGKSSLISSIQSALKGKIIQAVAPAGQKDTSLTKKLELYPINNSFQFIDTMGLEPVEPKQLRLRVDYLVKAVQGHVRNGHEFTKDNAFDEKDPFYQNNPSMELRAHCVAIVINAQTEPNMSDDVLKALQRLQDKAQEEGIPVFVLLTHIDELMTRDKKDVWKVHRSTRVHELVNKVSGKIQGLPEGQIFPIINYRKEVEKSELSHGMDCLLLIALRQMLESAKGHVEKLLSTRGNNPIECCEKP